MPRIKKTIKHRNGVNVKEHVIARSEATKQSSDSSRLPRPPRRPRNDEGKGRAMDGIKAELVTTALSRDGLLIQAFAIAPDPRTPAGWQLPHHTQHILKNSESSVDWLLIEKATRLLSLQGDEGRRVTADPALIIDAARHIAGHYQNAGKPIPTALCVLI